MDENEKILQSVLLEKSPILFLGAGFSAGALQRDGKTEVPGGQALKKDYLIPKLLHYEEGTPEYEETINYSLSKLCSFIDDSGLAEEKNRLLVDIFQGVVPDKSQESFFQYNWRRIYTTNIDDLVENIFQKSGKKLYVQNSRTRIEQKQKNQNGNCEYFKLHGCVNRAGDGFTFSTKEYVTSMQAREDYRFNEFCRDIQFEDFIFVGTAFDEINIEYFLQLYEDAGYSSRGRLIFINKGADLALKGRIRRMNAVLLEWDWQELIRFIDGLDRTAMNQQRYLMQKMQLRHFYSMKYYEKIYRGNLTYRSELYYGAEPTMIDILADWDFVNPDCVRWVKEIAALPYSACITLTGKRMIGKSCAALRMLKGLEAEGFEVFDYATPSFDERLLLDYVRQSRREKFAFYLDEGAYFYRNIRDILRKCPAEKKVLFLVATSLKKHHKWRYCLQKTNTIDKRLEGSISEKYAEEILDKLKKHAQLGRLGGLSPEEQKKEVMDTNDLMTFLMKLTDSDSFWLRYEAVIHECIDEKEEFRRFFALLFLFDRCDLPYVPAEYVPLMFGGGTKDMLNRTADVYRPYRGAGYRLRGRRYESSMRSFLSGKILICEIEHLCQVIAPQVTEYEKNYYKNILETVIKPKEIYKLFSFTGEEKKQYREMLYRLHEFYGSISYYWIQLGLAEQLEGDYKRAMTHFEQAQSIRPSSYSVLHAMARNYIRQASGLKKSETIRAQELFAKGEQQMLSLISEQEYEQNMPYSIHTYLLEKIYFCRKFSIVPPDGELKKMLELCDELERRDIPEVFRPVKKRLYRYLLSIDRGSFLKRIAWKDIQLLANGPEGEIVLPDDPEDD